MNQFLATSRAIELEKLFAWGKLIKNGKQDLEWSVAIIRTDGYCGQGHSEPGLWAKLGYLLQLLKYIFISKCKKLVVKYKK